MSLLLLALLHTADITTTQIALRTPSYHLREGNPFLPQNPTLNLVVDSSLATIQIYVLYKLKEDHPKLAKWITIGSIAAEGLTVAHNIHELKR